MYEDAYRVPFRLESTPPTFRLLNESDERVTGVAVTMHGAGMLAANRPATLLPGERLEIVVSPEQRERGGLVVVRWFRINGIEYLWRATL